MKLRVISYLVAMFVITSFAGAAEVAPNDSVINSDLSLWLRDPATYFDINTNTWADISGNGRDAVAAGVVAATGIEYTGPTLASEDMFGRDISTVYFHGGKDDLLKSSSLNGGTGLDSLTIFAVYKAPVSDDTRPVGFVSRSGGDAQGDAFNLQTDPSIRKDNGKFLGYTVAHPDDSIFIRTSRMNSAGVGDWFNDGVTLVKALNESGGQYTTQNDSFYLGDLRCGFSPVAHSTCTEDFEIAEVIVYNAALTDAQIAGVNEWIKANVGVVASQATNMSPANYAEGVALDVKLTWTAGDNVSIVEHQVYISDGANKNMVLAGLVDAGEATEFTPANLVSDVTYYWKVDEKLSSGEVIPGKVQQFSTVRLTPVIVKHPVSKVVKAGTDVDFVVEASDFSGNGLEYQWYIDPNTANEDVTEAVALEEGADFTGVATDTLTVLDVQDVDNGAYFCTVGIVGGNSVNSDYAKLKAGHLIAHWPFDGNADDVSGNEYHGEAAGSVSYSVDGGMIGRALRMSNANNGHIEVPAEVLDDVREGFTMSFWTYGSAEQPLANLQNLVHAKTSGADAILLRIPHTTGRFQMFTGNPDDGNTGIYDSGFSEVYYKNRWNNFVITKEQGKGINVYINGELWKSFANHNKPVYGATQMFIGGSNAGTNDTFDGMIDDFRIYNYIFNEDEVKEVNPTPVAPEPEDNATNVPFDTDLSWTAGQGSEKFKVYYSTTGPDQYAEDFDPNFPLPDAAVIDGLTSPQASFGFNLAPGRHYYWYVVEFDASGNQLWRSNVWSFTVVTLVSDLDDNLKVNLDDYAPIANHWGEDTSGIVTEAAVVDAMDYDVANLDPDDPASADYYWMHYYEYSNGTNLVYGEGYCKPILDPNDSVVIEWSYDTPSSTGETDASWLYYHNDRSDLPLNQYDEIHIDMRLVEGNHKALMWGNFQNTNGTNFSYNLDTSVLSDGQWHTIIVPIPDNLAAGKLRRFFCGYWGSNITGKIQMRNVELVVNDETPRCVPEFYIAADINNDCLIDLEDLSVLAFEWLLDASNPE
ncbi:MAG: hypothetical protein JEZ07_19135 [Phycisphaerae bacterium]|nr:hypothetical protein [Phycisphaerae bacterium]